MYAMEIFLGEFEAPGDYRLANTVYYGMADPGIKFPFSINQFQREETDNYEQWLAKFEPQFGSMTFGPTEQLKIVADCQVFAADQQNVVDGESYCVLNELQKYDPVAFPYTDEAALFAALTTFYTSPYYAGLLTNYTEYGSRTGFVADPAGGIRAVYVSFNSTMPLGTPIAPNAIGAYCDGRSGSNDAWPLSAAACGD
jgi:hypothetical protein